MDQGESSNESVYSVENLSKKKGELYDSPGKGFKKKHRERGKGFHSVRQKEKKKKNLKGKEGATKTKERR